MEPIAYLTVEIKHRDLESRLMIADHLLQMGISVVVGQQWSIFNNPQALPRGAILFKTVNGIQAPNMAGFRKHGHVVAATDEEVLSCADDRGFMTVFSPVAAANCDLFLAQSEFHKGAVERRFPDLIGRVHVTGNPRIDVISPRGRGSFVKEAEDHKRAHGPYILFNTNYGSLNSIWKSISHVADIAVRAGVIDLADPASVQDFERLLAWETRNREELINFIQWAADALPEYTLVVRPHPGEHIRFWREALAGIPRAALIARSSPHPWILGAELVVHTGCTTGLEAALLGKPAVNLLPIGSYIDMIISRVNPTFASWQEGGAAAEAFLKHGAGPLVDGKAACDAVLDDYFPGHDSGNSAETIAHMIADLLRSRGAIPRQDYQFRSEGVAMMPRLAIYKDKFTASATEIKSLIENIRRQSKHAGQVNIGVLDDSLFFLTPV